MATVDVGQQPTKTTVTVMHHEVASESDRRKVVDTTCAIGDVSHDQGLDAAKLFQDIRDGAGENQESFRKLQCDCKKKK